MDVSAEGLQAISNLDIYAQAGKNVAYDRSFSAQVNDGTLDLAFSTDVDNAKLSALLIQSNRA